MAIIVDPDFLDRNQIVYNTENQTISMYPVGALRHASSTDTDGSTASTLTFTDADATFQTWLVVAGDILVIKNGPDAGHYQIATVPTETTVTVNTFTGFAAFGTASSLVYDIRLSSGGTAADGATLQSIYSFSKEEWRVDSATYGGDDLIRHEFPFEAITSEQFEIGGSSAHADWAWFDGPLNADTTINYVRTGGWAAKNTAGTTLTEYAGIITLGSIDADAQVYYQQIDTTTAPTNFVLPGVVNQAVFTWASGDDRRTFLKLFVRKKARTYAGSAIGDIGVTNIQTIVNRFPLAHTLDSAISSTDGEILGSTPYRNTGTVQSGSDGSKTIGGFTFTSAGSTFQTSLVVAGDTLNITSGTGDVGYYTIATVNSETQLTIAADADFSGWVSSESSLSFTTLTTIRSATKAAGVATDRTDGALADVSTVTGTLTSASSNFTTDGVVAGDVLVITEAASGYRGLYPVISVDSATVLTVDTTDTVFAAVSNIDFRVVRAGMYLQYKYNTVTLAATGDLTFANANPDTIVRASGSWSGDGVAVGDIITITGSASNDGSYTAATVGTTTLTLVATDSLVAEGPVGAVATAFAPFKRTISGVVYGFKWKLLGNDGLAQDCYQFIQHQLRQTTDIDYGPGLSRGDVTDLLMSYSTPTGTTTALHIDDINAADLNNVTFRDATLVSRTYPYVAAGSLAFNVNLQNDASAKYWVFFTTNPAGNYSTLNAVIVNDAGATPITGNVSAQPSVSFTFDYDGNVQGGRTPGTDAAVTIVAIGLTTAQFVITTGLIQRSKANNFSLVSSLERNYSNPV